MNTVAAGPRGWSQGRTGLLTFLAAGLVVAALNAGFQRFAAARVDLDDLGAFNALVSLVGGVGLLGLGVQVVLARAGTTRLAVGRASVVLGVVTGALATAVVPGPAWYRLGVGVSLGVAFAAVMLGVPHRARLLADASWRRLAVTYLSGATVRLSAIVPIFAVVDNRLLGVMIATALGEATTSVTAWILARPQYSLAWTAAPTKMDTSAARLLLRSAGALSGLWVLTIADTVVARVRFTAADADAYAFASTAARSSFFVAVLLAHLALPTFMQERGRSSGLRRAFGVTIGTIAIGAAATAGVLLVAPRWSGELLLGVDGRAIDPTTMRWLTVAWATMSVLPLLTYFHLDRHPRVAYVPLVGASVSVALGSTVERPTGLAMVLAAVAVASAIVMVIPATQRLSPVTRSVSWHAGGDLPRPTATDVTVVIPFYNPGPAVVVDTVRRLVASLSAAGIAHHVIAVSDGSTDGSAEAIRNAAMAGVEVLELGENRGKGAAVRTGLARSAGSLVGYLDADGDLPPEQVAGFVDIALRTGADAVLASKLHPDSRLDVEPHRQLLSMVFRTLVRVLFRLDVRDTQTGLKLYRGDVLDDLVPLLREDGFAVDVEILVAAMRSRQLSIVEAPVQIVRTASSTVSFRRAMGTIVGLGRIFWRNHVALAYEPSVARADAGPM